jgi:cell division protein FtsI/penicillin-binding protein 2
MTRRGLLGLLAALPAAARTLADETAARLLARSFPTDEVSYLLVNAETRHMIAARGLEPDRPIPVGSVLKPFVAVAYAHSHAGDCPLYVCHGTSDRCWKPGGHGRLTLAGAIAQSCNAYFLALSRGCDPQDIRETALSLELTAPMQADPETWIGIGSGWPVAPLALVRAYCELSSRGSKELVSGLRDSARNGTARAIGCPALAKTGTAPCRHAHKAPGDGYAVAVFPPEAPRFALLASVHSAPGSEAARFAGQMLRAIG